jgi:RES domain-containing protein
VRFRGTVYRAHHPRWAFSPLSGEGAATTGGRFNPRGTPALYTSLKLETLFKEVTQGLARRLDPLTLCAYEVDCDDVVDLASEEGRSRAGVVAGDLGCAWKLLAFEGQPVPSWVLARRLIGAGAAGILAPSFAPGATGDDLNLVLWRWGPDAPYRVVVHDPDRRLPKDGRSWSCSRVGWFRAIPISLGPSKM